MHPSPRAPRTYGYTAFGLAIDAELELPELLPAAATSDAPRAMIRLGDVALAQDESATGPDRVLVLARRGDACLDYPGVARYRVTGGQQIIVEPAAGADIRLVRLFLLGPAMALLLHQRGRLVLHASGVVIGGRAIALLGEKGEGKSTLAAAMHARGHPLVSDDLMPMDLGQQDCVWVSPGYPHCKLLPESVGPIRRMMGPTAEVELDDELLTDDLKGDPKRAFSARKDFPRSAVPLTAIVVLATGEREGIEPLAPQQRFVELVRHSYLAPMLERTGESAAHFRQVVALAQRVPIYRFQRRRDIDRLPHVASLLEGQAAGWP